MRRRRRCCRGFRRWRGASRPTSAWSAAAIPGCRRRCTWRRRGSTWCCWRRSGWAGARRGGTAGRSGRGSGGSRTGWSGSLGGSGRGRSGTWPRRRRRWSGGWWRGTGSTVDLRPGVIHAACRAGEVAGFHEEAERLARDYGYDEVEALDRDGIRERLGTEAYHGGVLDRGAAHLHPLNFALGLARAAVAAGVRIFEGSRVEAIGEGAEPEVRTAGGAVRARFVVVAGNGYLGGLAPEMAARVMPINNFIVATAPLGRGAGAGVDPRRCRGGGFAVRRQLLPAVG